MDSVPCQFPFRVLAAIQAETYSGEIIKGIQNNKNLGVTDQCLFLFGNGDGGGGPTPAMMERVCPRSYPYAWQSLTQ